MGTEKFVDALTVESLSIGYTTRKKTIVIARDISFSVGRGELVSVIGINGIGKSTLLRTLAGMQPKQAGDILINGSSLESKSNEVLAKELSVVLTEPVASGNLTVTDLISLGRQPYTNWLGTLATQDMERIDSVIILAGLETLRQKKCSELSDGQLQKVLIARALAQDTALMLLDEPTTHLDLYHKVQVLQLLRRIAHESLKSILFTTHEIDLAIQLCDKILILNTDDSPYGAPSALIANRSFEALFPSDSISFDADSATFRVRN